MNKEPSPAASGASRTGSQGRERTTPDAAATHNVELDAGTHSLDGSAAERPSIRDTVDWLATNADTVGGSLVDHRVMTGRSAQTTDVPLRPELSDAIHEKGIDQVYAHQAEAIMQAQLGEHVTLRSINSRSLRIAVIPDDQSPPGVSPSDDLDVLGELPLASGLRDAHPGAIYFHQGQRYRVTDIDLDPETRPGASGSPSPIAWVEPKNASYTTSAVTDRTLTLQDADETRGLPGTAAPASRPMAALRAPIHRPRPSS